MRKAQARNQLPASGLHVLLRVHVDAEFPAGSRDSMGSYVQLLCCGHGGAGLHLLFRDHRGFGQGGSWQVNPNPICGNILVVVVNLHRCRKFEDSHSVSSTGFYVTLQTSRHLPSAIPSRQRQGGVHNFFFFFCVRDFCPCKIYKASFTSVAQAIRGLSRRMYCLCPVCNSERFLLFIVCGVPKAQFWNIPCLRRW